MGLPLRKSKVIEPSSVCPLTECMRLLQGAWAPNVIWYLSGEPRRFGELRHDIPPISARVLSARLRELETKGLITRRVLDTSPPSAEYALTELGRELIPAIRAIVEVGMKLKERVAVPRQAQPKRSQARRRAA
ncbi:winged helix-turn-helix transcriptional regulator [Agrilutibacter solisilvae]|uniref:Helix-turn-helix transcriptional regulator n=1 Tax=Agrilutibacter solisilvae TaxID=2763317 RepID=A0A974XX28_9GAMM|nr:helix-turn-helix domain-containing protein [Lysobacter solisilvae]QSX77406.1 helix-turn-helix transcriptional regulator [Lysobacter solisilvae]